MHSLWISILLFGSSLLVNGYFHVPGIEFLETPPDHLFRAGSEPHVYKWDSSLFTVKSSKFKPAIPHMHSFYLKMDDPPFKLKPSGKDYFHQPQKSYFSFPSSGFHKENEMPMPIQNMPGYTNKLPMNEVHGYSGERERRPPKTSFFKSIVQHEQPYSPMSELSSPAYKDGQQTNEGEQRVVGGRDVSDGEVPWQVSLQRKSMKSGRIFHICGGSIINREWVVTAAHCVALALLDNYRIVAATTNLRDDNRIKGLHSHEYAIHKVADVHIHDEYDMFRFRNDIALIRVEPPFEYGNNIQAISLPPSGHTAHGMAYASGWGLTQEGVRVTPSRLQAVALPLLSDGECRQAYGNNMAETMICAGYKEGGKSVCQGDSGGPLFQNSGGHAVLVGVVSWGVGCARPGKPGVYTEVSHYIGWIEDITGGRGRQNYVR